MSSSIGRRRLAPLALGLVCLSVCAALGCASDAASPEVATRQPGGGGVTSGGPSATETNVAPLHCNTNADCPHAAACVDSACAASNSGNPAAESDAGAELPSTR